MNLKQRVGAALSRLLGDLQSTGVSVKGPARTLNLRLQPNAVAKSELTLDLGMVGAALSAGRTEVGFIQIGAFDGLSNDPLHELIMRYGWRGVLVEPQADVFEALQHTYRDVDGLVLIKAAVAERAGEMTLWRFAGSEPGDPSWLPQISSFDRGHVLKYTGDQTPATRIIGELVSTVTLGELFDLSPRHVDVLQIDAEGYDAKIVNMLDLETHRPAVIRFEHRHVDRAEYDATATRLAQAGYRLALTGDDTIAVWDAPEEILLRPVERPR